jgi:hypothetical protein
MPRGVEVIENTVLLAAALLAAAWLFRPALRRSTSWVATVTPLASIIGSGFLVVAPLLAHAVDGWAPVAMTVIVLLAYAIGAVIRFNIRHAEPLLGADGTPRLLLGVERFSDLALGFAYLISVAFYVRLLASFVLRAADTRNNLYANLFTTAVLLFIGVTGLRRGLGGLERLEEYAVNLKLAIIVALLLGLAWFDPDWVLGGGRVFVTKPIDNWVHAARMLAGILLVVQGFETSRYLGTAYDTETRIRTMRQAQIISSIIYIVFVALASPLLVAFHGTRDETAIITMSAQVAAVLPAMLVVAAVMSQFSAAVADTAGGGGLFSEFSRRRVSLYRSYLLVVLAAIVVTWSANIFEIIVLASRAFAFYYFLQCLVGLIASTKATNLKSGHLWRSYLVLMALALLLVVLFATPDP